MRRQTRRVAFALALGLLSLAGPVSAGEGEDLLELSLEELMNVEVTSVSKRRESKVDAAAAVTVLTEGDIRRSGMTTVPELLRLVPGVQVARITANRWAISVRGLNQEFANKLLVLVDGRSVYTPYFGGTYWDFQQYPIEDIARIEVIRGPGGAVWGENAVNGVINIITKHARDTKGALIAGHGGTQGYGSTLRYGGDLGSDVDYRVFAQGLSQFDFDTTTRYSANDEWRQLRVGFRVDGALGAADEIRVSAEFYDQDADSTRPAAVPGAFDTEYNEANGGHVLVAWNHAFGSGSNLRMKGFYDRINRRDAASASEDRQTADLELQHDLVYRELDLGRVGGRSLLEGLDLSYGGGFRFSSAHASPQRLAAISPNTDRFHLGSGFLQMTGYSWDERVAVTLGARVGVNNWSGLEYQPSLRMLVKPVEGQVVWGAVSRAVRLPTQVDRDLLISIGALTLRGSNDLRGEDLTAFELGYRLSMPRRLTAEVSLYYNLYENSTAFRFIGPTTLRYVNQGRIATRGFEVEVKARPAEWWTSTLGYAFFDVDEDYPATTLRFVPAKGANPDHQVMLRQSLDLSDRLQLDTTLFYVDGLSGRVPSGRSQNIERYVRLDLRLAYRPTDWIELAIVGQNLTDRRHYEFTDVQLAESSQIPRTVHLSVRLDL